MDMLSWLTGKDSDEWNISLNDEENQNIPITYTYRKLVTDKNGNSGNPGMPAKGLLFASAMVLGCLALLRLKNRV